MVDSIATAKAAAASIGSSRTRMADNFETFLTLLTTQLKNQDPLSPMDGNQFTQQLTQMTGVEQQLLTNQLLQSLVASAAGGDFGDPIAMIGKVVTAQSDGAALTADGANWAYEMPRGVAKATMEVRNSAGVVVWSGPASNITAGRHAFAWDGQTSAGRRAADGVYSLMIKAEDAQGRAMTGKIFAEGVVTGVEQSAEGGLLSLGALKIPLGRVTAVRATT
jgi:flagellar basal-body rod modification protein FlgD